jgi:hypothetical protein
MSDDRDGIQGRSAPPTQDPTQPPDPAAPLRRTPWGWIIAAILAVVLIVLISLYFFTDLLSRPARNSLDDRGSPLSRSGASSTGPEGGTTEGQGLSPSPTVTPTATQPSSVPTASGLVGTWGESCPAPRDSVTFSTDGRFRTSDGEGTWSLSGANVILNGEGAPMVTHWVMLSPTEARVTLIATGETDTVRKCF